MNYIGLLREPPQPTMLPESLAALEKLGFSLAKLKAEAAKVEPNPTEAQKESGNYKKGHVAWKGLNLTIETAKDGYRRGVGKDGKPWSAKMHAHYGYVKRTESDADGDHIDIFLAEHHPESEIVFIVNQVDPTTGKFDEHKCVLGCITAEQAKKVYMDSYNDGWQGFKSITPITLDHFKWWMEHADTSKEIKDGMWTHADNRKKASDGQPLIVRMYWAKTAADKDKPFTIAVDFDGTIAEKEEPFSQDSAGKPRKNIKKWLSAFRAAGARIIVFTVRGNTEFVRKYMDKHNLPFDYINENPDQPNNSSGKVIADVYWDDRAYNAEDLDEFGPTILEQAEGEESDEQAAPPGSVLIVERTRILMGPADIFDEIMEASDAEGNLRPEQGEAA